MSVGSEVEVVRREKLRFLSWRLFDVNFIFSLLRGSFGVLSNCRYDRVCENSLS